MTDATDVYANPDRRRRAQLLAARLVEDALRRELVAWHHTPHAELGHDLDGLIVMAELVSALRHPDGDLDDDVADTLSRAVATTVVDHQ